MAFAGLASANAAFHLAGLSPFESWLAGSFVALGYLTHLCLDEIASVDLLGNRVKRSFGSALKVFSLASPQASLGMLVAVIALSVSAPTLELTLGPAEALKPIVDALRSLVETPIAVAYQ
jgi:hypothetical protein